MLEIFGISERTLVEDIVTDAGSATELETVCRVKIGKA